MSAVARLRPDQALEAAGYIRVSLERQAEGYSPDVQRDAIRKLAAEQGYALTMIEEDHERGSNVSRAGYQRIIEAVRAGTIHAVIVFMFDRWGRDGAEWITRAREFERLHVPIISVQEGRDEGGLMRFMRAGMAEEYSRQLAKRVRPSRERAARAGVHMGATPLGYKRVYPAHVGTGRRPPGLLVIDEATAWLVHELFDRYAAGGSSIRRLVHWLETDERVPLPLSGKPWSTHSIKGVLHNPVYAGWVRFNHRPTGMYERATPDTEFIERGLHEPLITQEVFDTVQRRLMAATARKSYNRHGGRDALARGLLQCAGCGGPMGLNRRTDSPLYYQCGWRAMGRPCTTRSYLAHLAHDALLTEARRLRGAPWTPQAEGRLLGTEGQAGKAEAAVAAARGLEQERERLRRHTRLMSLTEEDPTPEQIATFREVSAEISARIRALEAQLATSTHRAAQMPTLRELHARLSVTEIASVMARLEEHDDMKGLRALLQDLIVSAHIVERRPETHPTWLRAAVVWTPDVQTLLDASLLHLDPPAPGPAAGPSPEERQRAYERHYRELHRDRRNAQKREQRRRRALHNEPERGQINIP